MSPLAVKCTTTRTSSDAPTKSAPTNVHVVYARTHRGRPVYTPAKPKPSPAHTIAYTTTSAK